MKINIKSSCDKKVSCKIYDYNGGRRKLLRKGRFLHSVETEVKTDVNQLIVRVRRRSLFVAFLTAVYVALANALHSPGMSHSLRNVTYHLFPFEEILVKDLPRAETVKIEYNPAPMVRVEYRLKQNFKIDYLSCKTHPYEDALTGRVRVNNTLYVLAAAFWIALIIGICLIIRFFVLHL